MEELKASLKPNGKGASELMMSISKIKQEDKYNEAMKCISM